MDMIITFPGNKKVDAEYKGFTIHTDQPVHGGGDNSHPAPFDLFLASIGTCCGIYVVYFCEKRGIPLDNIRIVQRMERNREKGMIERITIDIEVPPDFPEKYHAALVHSVDLCAVKRHMVDPPEFEIKTVATDPATGGE
jgi:ribosomal protein S12 methylthiotransferase accessory factor